MNPIKIELVNQSPPPDWWLPWLPVLGSLLVAVAALVGVGWQIRGAEQRAKNARTEAQLRDFLTWRRDRVLEVASDLIEATYSFTEEFNSAGFPAKVKGREFVVPPLWSPVRVPNTEPYERTIRHGAAKLKVIGERELAERAAITILAMEKEPLAEGVARTIAILQDIVVDVAPSKTDRLDAERVRLMDDIGRGLAAVIEARADFEACAQWVLRESVNPSDIGFPEKTPIVPSSF